MKHLTGLFFCLICSFPAFSINEQLEYKVQNKSMYFYFSADTLFLEILAIDKPIRYTVDTFFRMKSDSNSFSNEKK